MLRYLIFFVPKGREKATETCRSGARERGKDCALYKRELVINLFYDLAVVSQRIGKKSKVVKAKKYQLKRGNYN